MNCQKGKVCVKQPGNAPDPVGQRCTGCDKTGKDRKPRCSRGQERKLDKKDQLIALQQELIDALETYIKMIGEELGGVAVIAHIHGWRSSCVEEGQQHREKINGLKAKCAKLVIFGKSGE
jgi:hypothetical protein